MQRNRRRDAACTSAAPIRQSKRGGSEATNFGAGARTETGREVGKQQRHWGKQCWPRGVTQGSMREAGAYLGRAGQHRGGGAHPRCRQLAHAALSAEGGSAIERQLSPQLCGSRAAGMLIHRALAPWAKEAARVVLDRCGCCEVDRRVVGGFPSRSLRATSSLSTERSRDVTGLTIPRSVGCGSTFRLGCGAVWLPPSSFLRSAHEF